MRAPDEGPPRCGQHEFEVLAYGKTMSIWAMRTPHSLAAVLADGFFDSVIEHNPQVGDRIEANCGGCTEHARLVVTDVHRDHGVRVAKLE
jgi:hypothetical protein